MHTNIDLQDDLLKQVITLGHFSTKKAAVNSALFEYSKILKRRELLKLKGEMKWQGDLEQLRRNRE